MPKAAGILFHGLFMPLLKFYPPRGVCHFVCLNGSLAKSETIISTSHGNDCRLSRKIYPQTWLHCILFTRAVPWWTVPFMVVMNWWSWTTPDLFRGFAHLVTISLNHSSNCSTERQKTHWLYTCCEMVHEYLVKPDAYQSVTTRKGYNVFGFRART